MDDVVGALRNEEAAKLAAQRDAQTAKNRVHQLEVCSSSSCSQAQVVPSKLLPPIILTKMQPKESQAYCTALQRCLLLCTTLESITGMRHSSSLFEAL